MNKVRCDGCKVWIHSACDQISHKHFKVHVHVALFQGYHSHLLSCIEINFICYLKDLGETDYYCPTCRTKFNFELSDSEKQDSKSK